MIIVFVILYSRFSQLTPSYGAVQWHLYSPIKSSQLPPNQHGELAHSLISAKNIEREKTLCFEWSEIATNWCTQAYTTAVETYGPHMANIWGAHTIPICSPFVRHRGKISKTTKSYVAHMLSNIWGNLWATLQHMGKCGHFCIQISPSVWTAYGEYTGNTPKATSNKTSPFPCWCSTLKDSQVSTKFVLKVCLLSKKMAEWILDQRPPGADEILTWQQASVFAFSINLML